MLCHSHSLYLPVNVRYFSMLCREREKKTSLFCGRGLLPTAVVDVEGKWGFMTRVQTVLMHAVRPAIWTHAETRTVTSKILEVVIFVFALHQTAWGLYKLGRGTDITHAKIRNKCVVLPGSVCCPPSGLCISGLSLPARFDGTDYAQHTKATSEWNEAEGKLSASSNYSKQKWAGLVTKTAIWDCVSFFSLHVARVEKSFQGFYHSGETRE